jgi:hypothetical protein
MKTSRRSHIRKRNQRNSRLRRRRWWFHLMRRALDAALYPEIEPATAFNLNLQPMK